MHRHPQLFDFSYDVACLFKVEPFIDDVIDHKLAAAFEADFNANAACVSHFPPTIDTDCIGPAHCRPWNLFIGQYLANIVDVPVAEIECVVIEIN